jgi:hypothetical protein
MSKLLLGLDTAAFNAITAKRLDAFQTKCLRKILGITHSYFNPVPNSTIYMLSSGGRLNVKLQRLLSSGGRGVVQLVHDPEFRVPRNGVGTDFMELFL